VLTNFYLTGIGPYLMVDGATRLYFEPGTSVHLHIDTNGDTHCTLSGYTVDATP
jgi:hypothetical protein